MKNYYIHRTGSGYEIRQAIDDTFIDIVDTRQEAREIISELNDTINTYYENA